MHEFTGESPMFRTAYNYDTDSVSRETGLACPDDGLTQQHHSEEADINTIVRRFGLTGQLPQAREAPEYGDFSHVTDYHTAMNAVLEADQHFMALPAELRAQFNNDPGALLDFVYDDNNRAKAEEMGLVPKKKTGVESPPATTPTTEEPKK
jgi:phage internal scaffolding protein